MFFNGVPDMLSFARTSRVTNDLKIRLEQTSVEAITGRREDITAATGGDVGSAHLLKKALDDVNKRSEMFSTTATRLDLMSQALQGSRAVVNDMDIRALAALTVNEDTSINVIVDEARSSLKQVFSILNVNHGNRNLFSGAATDQQSLVDVDGFLDDIQAIVAAGPTPADIDTALDTYFNDPAGGFQTSVYGGSSQNVAALNLADNTRVEFEARADNQAIKDLLRGLATLAVSDAAGFDRRGQEYNDLFRNATDHITQGTVGMVEIEANIGITANLIAKNDDLNEAERITLTKAYNDATGRDQYEAANELALLETQLQASYTLTARLNQLTLVNFIR